MHESPERVGFNLTQERLGRSSGEWRVHLDTLGRPRRLRLDSPRHRSQGQQLESSPLYKGWGQLWESSPRYRGGGRRREVGLHRRSRSRGQQLENSPRHRNRGRSWKSSHQCRSRGLKLENSPQHRSRGRQKRMNSPQMSQIFLTSCWTVVPKTK